MCDSSVTYSVPFKRDSSSQLLDVPGVGPKNEALLKAVGIVSVRDLASLHTAQHGADYKKTQVYLKEVVGIKNKSHVASIMQYLSCSSQKIWLEQQQPTYGSAASLFDRAPPKFSTGHSLHLHPKLTLSVEGNISAGKSTFLQILQDCGLDRKLQVVPEPVHKWQNVGDGKANLLLEFYQDPKRMAYTFQNYVFLTRMIQERQSYASSSSRLLERSVFSDRMIFVNAAHNSQFINDTELAIYDSWFEPVLNTFPTLIPNGFIYLRAEADTCFRRMKRRSRNEENTVQLSYLKELHRYHEDWLLSGSLATKFNDLQCSRAEQIKSSASPVELTYPSPGVPASIRDKVRILDYQKGSPMLPQMHLIPTLVLDCDDDVDVEKDQVYRKLIASQVQDYLEYVGAFAKAKATALAKNLKYPIFNGYHVRDENGCILYTSPEWHALSHAQHVLEEVLG
ncbi:hypothetical protein CEUSTIGMA_g11125.t1 [Chlamydomonas eustigma]|uniref:Deoxynucleoside kinase domain-containing protein n=1 Tax=Chlamydomonas eustigma TaxID=1157962 RepID=A0A250XLP2_9CHLO|nr:hypothetical protein CEUSTIGMA_g11125.t1 [Chlamydomonas eustigma]|eukprot:GAX83700.1 hypothetical protein CEUSTIGMA_g11125.t1 [Chlamydomonas eustigma]